MTQTLTTAQAAELLKIQPKALRAFLRASASSPELPAHLTPVGSGGRYSFLSTDIPILSSMLTSSPTTRSSSDDLGLPPNVTIPNPLKDKKATAQARLAAAARVERLMDMMAQLPKRPSTRVLVDA